MDGQALSVEHSAAFPKKCPGTAHRDVALIAGKGLFRGIFQGAGHVNLVGLLRRKQAEGQRVVQTDCLHHHIHLMIAVFQPADDVQRKVDFAWGIQRDALHEEIPPEK